MYEQSRHRPHYMNVHNTQFRRCKQAAFPANMANAESKISSALWFADAQQAQEVCCSSQTLVAAHRGITIISEGDPQHNNESRESHSGRASACFKVLIEDITLMRVN